MRIEGRIARLERINPPRQREDLGPRRQRLAAKLTAIRGRLMDEPHLIPSQDELSVIERLALANTEEEASAILAEIRARLRTKGLAK